MAYYVDGYGSDNTSAIVANASVLSGSETVVFNPKSSGGSFWWKVPSPQIGQVIAALPDVSIITYPAGSSSVYSTTSLGTIQLYQAFKSSDGSISLLPNSTGAYTEDSVLKGLYPNSDHADGFEKLVVAPGQGTSGYLNQFYLQVSGDSSLLANLFTKMGANIPNVGRVLVTAGTITGARDAAWGNWRDVVKVAAAQPGASTTAVPPDLSSEIGTSKLSALGNGEEHTYNGVTYDPGTNNFYSDQGGTKKTDVLLTSEYQKDVASGMSAASSLMDVLNWLSSSAVVGTALQAVQAVGNPYPAAWAGGASQILTSVSLNSAVRSFFAAQMNALSDQLYAFDHGTAPIDIDSRFKDIGARFVFDAGTALSGPVGTAVSNLTSAMGIRLGNSQPEIDTFFKYADDTTNLTLSSGHQDKFLGTSFADMVTINSDSIAYGAGGNDILTGGALGKDILDGGDGNDTLVIFGAGNYLIGGDGTDTVVYSGKSSNYKFQNAIAAKTILRVDPAGNDTLSGIEKIKFSDGVSTVNADGTLPLNSDGTPRLDGTTSNVAASSFAISPTSAQKSEGNSGTTAFTFTVTRSGNASSAATLYYGVSGSGSNPAAASDFSGNSLPSGTISFASGSTTQAITLNVTGDTVFEPDESFTVQITGPTGTNITSATATGTILNDDIAPVTTPTTPISVATLGFSNATKNQSGTLNMDPAGAGGPSYLKNQYVYTGSDSVAYSTQSPGVFIHGGSGNDAIQVTSGQNVLDGGLGSNFLTGGTGTDTFFTDARSPGVVWNTIRNFHAGDAATLWGFASGISSYRWEAALAGAAGSEGATLRANIVGGNGRTGDGIDASITFTGLSVAQAKSLQVATGTQPAGSYLYLYNPGV